MQVQIVSNNNYYNGTFCANPKFNKTEYEHLQRLRGKIITGLTTKNFEPKGYIDGLVEFAVKCTEFPREGMRLQPINSATIKKDLSNSGIGLRQLFRVWKNIRKTKKEFRSMQPETFQQKISKALKEKNVEKSKVEEGRNVLTRLFGIEQ